MTDPRYGNHQSPFLPGTAIQFAWDSTSLSYLKECPRKYQLTMVEGYRLKGTGAVHLQFGQWYHSALELYDKLRAPQEITSPLSHDEALTEVVHQLLEWTWDRENAKGWDLGHNLKTRPHLVRTVIWYLEHFREDPAQTVILANGKPAVELSFKMELDFGPGVDSFNDKGERPYILSGHLDRVVEFNGGFYVMDRKTASSTVGHYYFDQYTPDNQMSLYSLAARVIYSTPVQGVIIDAAQIAVGFSRFERGFAHRTDAQLEEWLADTKRWLRLAEHYATEGHWPMNDKSCHDYGGCPFRQVCSRDPRVRQHILDTNYEHRYWNPLEPR